jgi:methylase of polypeptide subunit release factors
LPEADPGPVAQQDFEKLGVFYLGKSYDLIICNPPYVISPETDIVYRDVTAANERSRLSAVEHTLAAKGLRAGHW